MEKRECRPFNLVHTIVMDAANQGSINLSQILYDLFIDAQHLHNLVDKHNILYYCINKYSTHIITEDRVEFVDFIVETDAFVYRVTKAYNQRYDYIAERVNREEIKF